MRRLGQTVEHMRRRLDQRPVTDEQHPVMGSLPCHLGRTLGKGSTGALAVTKLAQLLNAAPLVILLVRLPHNVMASVSLCFPRRERERGGGAAFPALPGSLRCGEAWRSKTTAKDSTGKDPVKSIQCLASELILQVALFFCFDHNLTNSTNHRLERSSCSTLLINSFCQFNRICTLCNLKT